MEMFWRTKGKRIAAWLMIALIMATTIPFGSISASADDTTTDESDAVTITGQVMVPGNDDENTDTNNGTPYAGAKVTVTYPQSGSTPVTNEATTTDDGKFNISIGNWTLNTDNKYRCIHSLRHHEPTRVFYPLWFLFHRNVQVRNRSFYP